METPTPTVTVAVAVTPAHEQNEILHIRTSIPSHEPRESDPHYHWFNDARKRLKAAGALKCWVCGKDEAGAGQPIELHHSYVEFCFINNINQDRFIDAFPEFHLVHGDEEAFLKWVEEEGNLLALCKLHHTGVQGIHFIPYPIWQCYRYYRDDAPLPGVLVTVAAAEATS